MKIIDLHCDTIMALCQKDDMYLNSNTLQIDVNKLIKGNYMAQFFAMFLPFKIKNIYEVCLNMIDRYKKEVELNKDYIDFAYSYDDIINNSKNNKISAILSIEEGGVVEGSIDKLINLYNLGVRMICLNWNYINGIGHPNYGKFNDNGLPDFITPNTNDGLTPFGFEMIRKMNELGIIIDVSHLSDKGFWDCINNSSKPIVASHSNARSVCHHVRNLTDEMIIALNKNGGVMGMNYCQSFLSDDEEDGRNTIKWTVNHIKYIKDLVGVDVIALGSDFDGIDPNIELKDASMMNELIAELIKEGFTKEEINKITHENILRVIKENFK
jgi:membrane dipeptidase